MSGSPHPVTEFLRFVQIDVDGNPVGDSASGGGGSDAAYTLLSNASATGSYVEVAGGSYVWDAVGTFSGATLQLQTRGPDGSTAMNVTGAALTAAGSFPIDIGDGAFVRVLITGGPPSGMYSSLGAF